METPAEEVILAGNPPVSRPVEPGVWRQAENSGPPILKVLKHAGVYIGP